MRNDQNFKARYMTSIFASKELKTIGAAGKQFVGIISRRNVINLACFFYFLLEYNSVKYCQRHPRIKKIEHSAGVYIFRVYDIWKNWLNYFFR